MAERRSSSCTKPCAPEASCTFLNLVPLKWYEAVQSAPDWEELMDGVHRASKEEFKALEESWVEELTRVILKHRPDTASAREVAVFYYSSSKNAKYGVEDAEDLKARLSTIQRATLALLNSSV